MKTFFELTATPASYLWRERNRCPLIDSTCWTYRRQTGPARNACRRRRRLLPLQIAFNSSGRGMCSTCPKMRLWIRRWETSRLMRFSTVSNSRVYSSYYIVYSFFSSSGVFRVGSGLSSVRRETLVLCGAALCNGPWSWASKPRVISRGCN